MNFRLAIHSTFYIVVLIGALTVSSLMMIKVIGDWALPIQSDFQIHVLNNDTIYGVSNHLFSQNSIHHTIFLEVVYLDNSKSENLHPGMYTVHYGMSYLDLVQLLQGKM
ncbi:endolytic transglycosylase MltG [Gammaproteobacteria bacterium]|nr:endolytic transglycosylase MltG [Gammaproteobacteria bacterium]